LNMFSWSIFSVGLFFNFSLGKHYMIKTGETPGSKESSLMKKEIEDYGILNKGQFSDGFIQENVDCNGLGSLYFENVGEVRGKVEQRIVDCEDGMKFNDPTVTKPNDEQTTKTDEQTNQQKKPDEQTTKTPDTGERELLYECKDGQPPGITLGNNKNPNFVTCKDGTRKKLDPCVRYDPTPDGKVYCEKIDPDQIPKPTPKQNTPKGERKFLYECKDGLMPIIHNDIVTCQDGTTVQIESCASTLRDNSKVYCEKKVLGPDDVATPEVPKGKLHFKCKKKVGSGMIIEDNMAVCPDGKKISTEKCIVRQIVDSKLYCTYKKKGNKGSFRSGRTSRNNNGICTDRLGRIYNDGERKRCESGCRRCKCSNGRIKRLGHCRRGKGQSCRYQRRRIKHGSLLNCGECGICQCTRGKIRMLSESVC